MSAELQKASSVYVAALEKRRGGAVLQIARAGMLLVSEMTGGLLPAPSLSDVVVRHRHGADEITRLPAGDPAGAGDLLHRVRHDLTALDQAVFDSQWGIPPRGPSR